MLSESTPSTTAWWQKYPRSPALWEDTFCFTVYCFTYDPWIGKLLYLEDFFKRSDCRSFGLGAEILKNLSRLVVRCRSSCMYFLTAEWNEPSVHFYRKRGASDLSSKEGRRLFQMDRECLLKMAAEE